MEETTTSVGLSAFSPAERARALNAFVASYACHARVAFLDELSRDMAEEITKAAPLSVTIQRKRGPWWSRGRHSIEVLEGKYDVVVVHQSSSVGQARDLVSANGTIIGLGNACGALAAEKGSQTFALTEDLRVVRSLEARDVVVVRASQETRLHLGSGPEILGGWTNIDNLPYAGVDRILDLGRGLPFADVEVIFAEHFIEHLEYRDTRRLLRECRLVLRDDGVLRVSTPNLDWVHAVSYRPWYWTGEHEAVHDCLVLNRAFRGWGHKFLYNWPTLVDTLHGAGFAKVERVAYGESQHPALQNLERHAKYPDSPELPHIIVAEASGRRTSHERHAMVSQMLLEYERDLAVS